MLNVDKDWKNFYIKNPWIPTRILIKKFDLNSYDITNWKKANPHVNSILNAEKWKLSNSQISENIVEILTNGWKYYIEEELRIDLKDSDAVRSLIQIKNVNKSDFNFLIGSNYLSKVNGYKDWIDNGFTSIAFSVFHFFPGPEYSKKIGLLPALFFQSSSKSVQRLDALALIEHIYLRFLCSLTDESSSEDFDYAKRVFVARSSESSFLTAKVLREYGIGVNMLTHGSREAIATLRNKFLIDLQLDSVEQAGNWNANLFRKKHGHLSYTNCKYCGRKPIDLHHLLDRAQYPELTYHGENVVPLCVLVHASITRKYLTNEQQFEYFAAIKEWTRAREGDKLQTFDKIMFKLHQTIYG